MPAPAEWTAQSGQRFGIYDVEHVFWLKGGNPYGAAAPSPPPPPSGPGKRPPVAPGVPVDGPHRKLPESYVPPIIAVLPQMALNEPGLAEAAKASGTSLERAFEKSINAAFTILGYQTQLLGQGQGRVPDGQAIDPDNAYAIIWDAKVRANGYSIGTDDRAIREYITTQSRELKKKRSLQKIYYVIVSSRFADDYDDTIGAIKMETDVNEVCLLEADAVVAMVDQKLREPQQITLGPDGMQQLFRSSGVLTATAVLDILT